MPGSGRGVCRFSPHSVTLCRDTAAWQAALQFLLWMANVAGPWAFDALVWLMLRSMPDSPRGLAFEDILFAILADPVGVAALPFGAGLIHNVNGSRADYSTLTVGGSSVSGEVKSGAIFWRSTFDDYARGAPVGGNWSLYARVQFIIGVAQYNHLQAEVHAGRDGVVFAILRSPDNLWHHVLTKPFSTVVDSLTNSSPSNGEYKLYFSAFIGSASLAAPIPAYPAHSAYTAGALIARMTRPYQGSTLRPARGTDGDDVFLPTTGWTYMGRF